MRVANFNKWEIFVVMILIAAIGVGFVVLNAQATELQYDINKVNSEITNTTYEIANLEVKINSAANINNLEKRALAMGLVYPDYDKIVSVSGTEVVADFATALKSNAYN